MRLILDNIGIVVKQLQLILEFAIPTLPDLNRKIIEVGMRKMRNLAWFGHGVVRIRSYEIRKRNSSELPQQIQCSSSVGVAFDVLRSASELKNRFRCELWSILSINATMIANLES